MTMTDEQIRELFYGPIAVVVECQSADGGACKVVDESATLDRTVRTKSVALAVLDRAQEAEHERDRALQRIDELEHQRDNLEARLEKAEELITKQHNRWIAAGMGGENPGNSRQRAMLAVNRERNRQEELWGEQNHPPALWLGILGEEFGELCQAVTETVFDNGSEKRKNGGVENMLREACQVAAVAVSLMECLMKSGEGC